jgi:hypothetical protein
LEVEQGEFNDSAESLENFETEEAIKVVRKLGEGLIAATAHVKHRFRKEWIDDLVQRFKERPGRPIVHLSDLRDSVMPVLAVGARCQVAQALERYVKEEELAGARISCRNIASYARDEGDNPAKLRTWREFAKLTGFEINSLEPHVVALRLSGGRRMRIVKSPKFPINLASPAGGKLLGYRLDANYANSAFTNKNPLLHDDYRSAVTEVVGNLPITETGSRSSEFTSDVYLRTNVGNLVSTLMSVAGLDITKDQRSANNPAPLWLFVCPSPVIACFLAALWDAEGSVNKRDVKLRQAVELLHLKSRLQIPYWPDSVHLGELDGSTYRQVLECPPRILTSTALLLARLGIACHVMPERLSSTRSGVSVYWHLRIMRNNSVRAFYEQVRLLSPEKEFNLRRNVETMRWQWKRTEGFSRKAS